MHLVGSLHEFYGTPTGGGEKGSPPLKSSGFVQRRPWVLRRKREGIARLPSSSHC